MKTNVINYADEVSANEIFALRTVVGTHWIFEDYHLRFLLPSLSRDDISTKRQAACDLISKWEQAIRKPRFRYKTAWQTTVAGESMHPLGSVVVIYHRELDEALEKAWNAVGPLSLTIAKILLPNLSETDRSRLLARSWITTQDVLLEQPVFLGGITTRPFGFRAEFSTNSKLAQPKKKEPKRPKPKMPRAWIIPSGQFESNRRKH